MFTAELKMLLRKSKKCDFYQMGIRVLEKFVLIYFIAIGEQRNGEFIIAGNCK